MDKVSGQPTTIHSPSAAEVDTHFNPHCHLASQLFVCTHSVQRQDRYTQTLASWPHLAETALSQHHQEVKVRQLHAVLVAIGVEAGGSVGRLSICVLAWSNLSSLDGGKRRSTRSDKKLSHYCEISHCIGTYSKD